MRDFIIKPAWGGLGDHLFYSHLPRIAAETGHFDRVLVSNHSTFRHPDYKTLIWEANPYVNGFTDEDVPTLICNARSRGDNILDKIMLLHGLDDGQRLHEPELYISPPRNPALSQLTIYDPNFVSYVGRMRIVDVQEYLKREGLIPDLMLAPGSKSMPIQTLHGTLASVSLMDYCSIIVSAKRFMCLTSGGATLAAALAKPATALYASGQNPIFHHSALHRYVNVRRSLTDCASPRLTRFAASYLHLAKARLRQTFTS